MAPQRAVLSGLWPLACLAALAACAGGGPSPSSPAAPPIDWRTALRDDAVVVSLLDRRGRYRVAGVDLVGPSGARVAAREITRRRLTDDGYPQSPVRLGGSWGSTSGGALGLSVPLHPDSAGPARTETTATIPLPDPALYRQAPQRWAVLVDLTDPSGAHLSMRLPAPER